MIIKSYTLRPFVQQSIGFNQNIYVSTVVDNLYAGQYIDIENAGIYKINSILGIVFNVETIAVYVAPGLNILYGKKINPTNIGSGANAKEIYTVEFKVTSDTYIVEIPELINSEIQGMSFLNNAPINLNVSNIGFDPETGILDFPSNQMLYAGDELLIIYKK